MENADIQALLWLATDDNPAIARKAADELVSLGEQAQPHLATLADTDPDTAAEISRRIEAQSLEDRWRELANDPDAEQGALLIAQWADPLLDPSSVVADIDALAEPLAGTLPRKEDPESLQLVAQTLAAWLGEEHGFHGDTTTYYEPKNSFLHHVLTRKRGLPILLSLIYVLIGRRLGVPVYPIGMPAHFIVRVGPKEADLYLDPFDRGRILGSAQCKEWLEANGFGWRESFLDVVSDREFIARMLRNLVNSYRRQGDDAAQRELLRYYRILSGESMDISSP